MELNRLKEIIAEKLDLDMEEISLDASFKEDLGADSLDLMEVVMQIEEELGITIEDSMLEGIVTVQDAMKAIASAENNG